MIKLNLPNPKNKPNLLPRLALAAVQALAVLAGAATAATAAPQPAAAATSVVPMLALADAFGCLLTSDSKVQCWGNGFQGQLGTGVSTIQYTSGTAVYVRTSVTDTTPLSGVVAISTEGGRTGAACAVMNTGTVKCWGYLNSVANTTPRDIPIGASTPLSGVVQVSLGYDASGNNVPCMLMTTGTIKCGTTTLTDVPTSATNSAPLSGVKKISAGNHNCAVMNTGRLKCWGGISSNYYGQLGNGTTDNVTHPAPGDVYSAIPSGLPGTPTTPTPLTGVVDVQVLTTATCALLNTGKVRCWGYGTNGILGIDTLPYLSGSNGLVNSFTLNGGNPNPFENNPPAYDVDYLSDVAALANASNTSRGMCVVVKSGAVKCWGYSGYGLNVYDPPDTYTGGFSQIGLPHEVPGLNSVISAAVGDMSLCALDNTGAAYCLGSNGYSAGGYNNLGAIGLNNSSVAGGRDGSWRPIHPQGADGDINAFSSSAMPPALSISKSRPNPYPPVAGQPVAYTIAVTNTGTTSATLVTVQDLPATGLGTPTGFTGAGATCSTSLLTCTLPSLAGGATASFNIIFTAPAAGTLISNTAVIYAIEAPWWVYPTAPIQGMETFAGGGGGTTAATTNLKVTKTASVASATTGTAFNYTLSVTNLSSTAATNAVLHDKVPASLLIQGTPAATGGGSCSVASQVVTCNWASIPANGSATVTVSVTP